MLCICQTCFSTIHSTDNISNEYAHKIHVLYFETPQETSFGEKGFHCLNKRYEDAIHTQSDAEGLQRRGPQRQALLAAHRSTHARCLQPTSRGQMRAQRGKVMRKKKNLNPVLGQVTQPLANVDSRQEERQNQENILEKTQGQVNTGSCSRGRA